MIFPPIENVILDFDMRTAVWWCRIVEIKWLWYMNKNDAKPNSLFVDPNNLVSKFSHDRNHHPSHSDDKMRTNAAFISMAMTFFVVKGFGIAPTKARVPVISVGQTRR